MQQLTQHAVQAEEFVEEAQRDELTSLVQRYLPAC